MKRRFVLAMLALGALSATALAWAADSVVTIPLAPPPKATAEETKPAKSDKKPTTVATAAPTAEPLSPQAIVTIPAPAFSTETLFAPGLDLNDDAFPTPSVDPALIEGRAVQTKEVEPAAVEPPKQRLEARPQPAPLLMRSPPAPPMPQQKPTLPALKEQTAAAPAETARPLRRGEMEPIDDYRPKKPSSVVVDPTALDRALVPAVEKPARTPIPQPKPAAPKPKAEAKILAKGEMEPVDDVPGPKALITRRGEASTFRCFVRDVMAFYDRTHIRCYNKAKSKLNFFAVDTGQPISASVVSKGLAAMQAGKPATITFAPEADLNPSNCAAANCRRLIDIQN